MSGEQEKREDLEDRVRDLNEKSSGNKSGKNGVRG